MKSNIASRVAGVLSVVVVVATIAVSGAITTAGSDLLRDAAVKRLGHSAQIAGIRLSTMIDAVRQDTEFLTHSLAANRVARWRGADQPGTDALDCHETLAGIFAAILESRPWYFQVRFIEAGGEGREVVRVERVDGRIQRVTEERLQKKFHRRYFQDVIKLAEGEFQLSRIDLNREHGEISIPHVPTLRGARPVVSNEGGVLGFVIINVDMRPVFEATVSLLDPQETLYIVNNLGDFIFHSDPGKTFGSEQGKPQLAQQEMPEINSLIDGWVPFLTVQRTRSPSAKPGVGYFERVALGPGAGDRFLVLGVSTPDELVLEHVNEIRKRSATYTFVLAFVAVFAAFVATRLLTRPLAQLAKSTGQLVRGHHKAILPVGREDEIGELARNFHHLASELTKARGQVNRDR